MRRALLTLAVVLVLALAGCSGTDDGATTLTPAPEPTVPTESPEPTAEPTPTDAPATTLRFTTLFTVDPHEDPDPTVRQNATFRGVPMPPGTDRRGILDERVLVEAHARTAAGMDYRLSIERLDRVVTDGTVHRDDRGQVRVLADEHADRLTGRWRSNDTADGTGRLHDSYTTDAGTYTRWPALPPGERYDHRPDGFDETQADRAAWGLEALLAHGEWRPVGTTTVGNRTAVVFEESESDDGTNGTAVIDSRGLVHEFTTTTVDDSYESTETTAVTYRLDPTVDVTVEPPSWLDEAENATGER